MIQQHARVCCVRLQHTNALDLLLGCIRLGSAWLMDCILEQGLRLLSLLLSNMT